MNQSFLSPDADYFGLVLLCFYQLYTYLKEEVISKKFKKGTNLMYFYVCT